MNFWANIVDKKIISDKVASGVTCMLTELRLSGMWRSGVLIYQIHPTFPFSGTSGEEGASTSVVRTGCWSHRPEL